MEDDNSSTQQEMLEEKIIIEYEIIKKLGSGAYGHVWKVKHRSTNQIYAIKKIFLAFQNKVDAQRIYREISILHKLNHENIVKLNKIIHSEKQTDIYLVFECLQSDLFCAIRDKLLNPIHRKYIVYQLAKAVSYIHSAGILHRDLKPSNVLINANCQIRICDFGLSRTMQSSYFESPILTQFIATRWYRAPQVLFGSTVYSYKSDMWSLGCLIYELYTRRTLLPGDDTISQITKVLQFKGYPSENEIHSWKAANIQKVLSYFKVQPKPIQEYFDFVEEQSVKIILLKLLEYNPEKRWSAQQLLSSEFLEQFKGFQSQNLSVCAIQIGLNDNHQYTVSKYKEQIINLQGGKKTNLHQLKLTNHKPHRSLHLKVDRKQNPELSQHVSANVSPSRRYGEVTSIYKTGRFTTKRSNDKLQLVLHQTIRPKDKRQLKGLVKCKWSSQKQKQKQNRMCRILKNRVQGH